MCNLDHEWHHLRLYYNNKTLNEYISELYVPVMNFFSSSHQIYKKNVKIILESYGRKWQLQQE